MIVSHRHRFIFFAVPRTGTHAIRAALAPLLGERDWQQETLRLDALSPVPAIARIGHGHVTAQHAQAHLPATVWRSYFKFAMVRNPYERFVSACAMLNKRNPRYAGTEAAFMKQALTRERFRRRVLVRPQAQLLSDATGRLSMDFIGRYEGLQDALDQACRQIGLPCPELAKRNAAAHGPWADYRDAALSASVTRFYQQDFDAFGYEREGLRQSTPCA